MNKVNKCSICKIKSPFFIWTSSRYVSAGIRAMYPNDKVCLSCYEKQCKIHKPVKREDIRRCPDCGGKVITSFRGVGSYIREDYCQECGLFYEEL